MTKVGIELLGQLKNLKESGLAKRLEEVIEGAKIIISEKLQGYLSVVLKLQLTVKENHISR